MMEVKMPNGVILASDNKNVIDSYIKHMGGKLIETKKETKKSATKVASAKEAE